MTGVARSRNQGNVGIELAIWFAGVWVGYFVAASYSSFECRMGAPERAATLQFIFAVVGTATMVGVGALLELLPRQGHEPDPVVVGSPDPASTHWIIVAAMALSIVGVVAFAIDKVVIQEIDYTEGLATARNQWRQKGVEREGISSIFSVLGYLLMTAYIVGLALLVVGSATLRKSWRWMVAALIAACTMAIAALTGGRSILFLIAILCLALMPLRRLVGRSLTLPAVPTIVAALSLLAALSYSVFVFGSRAEATGFDAVSYTHSIMAHLGGRPTSNLGGLDPAAPTTDLRHLAALVDAYLTHSQCTFAAIIESDDKQGQALAVHYRNMLSRIGILSPADVEWTFAGLFPSLPGALYHDGGEPLLLLGSVFTATAATVAAWLFRGRPQSLVLLGAAALTVAIVLAAPFLLVADILNFPFMAISFVILWLANTLRERLAAIARRQDADRCQESSLPTSGSGAK